MLAVPPHKLIARTVPVKTLERETLKADTFNRKYFLEVGYVWMFKALERVRPAKQVVKLSDDKRYSDSELATLNKAAVASVEAFIAEKSFRVIDSFKIEPIDECAEEIVLRLETLLLRISEHCSFEKNNDAYLHTMLPSRLPATKTMIREPPFKAINEFFYDAANSIVRPLMIRDGKATFDAVALDSRTPESLISAVALLSEALDGDVPQVAINSGIHREAVVPFAFIGCPVMIGDQIGIRYNEVLYVPSFEDKHAVASIIYKWASLYSTSLFTALNDPAALQPNAGLYKFVH